MISAALRSTLDRIRPLLDHHVVAALAARFDALPKTPGSLGRLEDLVVHYSLIRGTAQPTLHRKGLYVFAADHGIAAELGLEPNASRALALQFVRGGSPVQVLCRQAQIESVLVNVGLRGDPLPGALSHCLLEGSLNSTRGPALGIESANRALELGLRLADEAAARFDVVALGQLGLGAHAAAAALLSAASGRDASETTPRLPGLDDKAHALTTQAVRAAVNRNQAEAISPFGALRSLGGLDFAALTGFLLGAAARRLPVILDGFCASAAALSARTFAPDSLDAAIFSHREPDPAHDLLLRHLAVDPVFDLQLRESEGFAAALTIQLLSTGLHLLDETRDLSAS